MKRASLGAELEHRSLTLEPIGVVRSPFKERMQAPRQPAAARAAQGTIELYPGRNFEHALLDLESFRYLWVVFWFHLNAGWRPKVLPPRSGKRRGVFATRSPHRPNPIGLSVVELLGVDRLSLSVSNLDMLDGTPVLDIKPYVPYTDSIAEAEHGWLAEPPSPDPGPEFTVTFAEAAASKIDFLERHFAVELRAAIERVLELGPAPHPYRRIKRQGEGFLLALKEWRVRFEVRDRTVLVLDLASGYRPRELELELGADPALEPHRALTREFAARRC